MVSFKDWLGLPEYRQKQKYPVNVSQWIEFAGAAMCTTGTYLIAGLGVALLVGAAFLVVAAEFIYGDPVMLTLPRAPHPIKRVKGWLKR
jgi:hypothetical protein